METKRETNKYDLNKRRKRWSAPSSSKNSNSSNIEQEQDERRSSPKIQEEKSNSSGLPFETQKVILKSIVAFKGQSIARTVCNTDHVTLVQGVA